MSTDTHVTCKMQAMHVDSVTGGAIEQKGGQESKMRSIAEAELLVEPRRLPK